MRECVSENESTLEEQALNKKKDLFEKGLSLENWVLVWK